MCRVARPGGVVACGTFDFWGGFSAQDPVFEVGSVLDEGINALPDHLYLGRQRLPDRLRCLHGAAGTRHSRRSCVRMDKRSFGRESI
jgi:hypothetical protein